jgi:hypothetical protein
MYPSSVIDPITLAVITSLLNIPYKWGGNSPLDGLDCSGVVIIILKSTGQLASNYDGTAQDLYNFFSSSGGRGVNTASAGCLCFYGKSLTEISHVTYCVDHYRAVGGNGGDRAVTNLAVAIAEDARVKISPISYRKDLLAIVKPHQPPFV